MNCPSNKYSIGIIIIMAALLQAVRFFPIDSILSNDDKEVQKTVDKFIELVFDDPKQASSMALGTVKFNLANMKDTGNYKIVDTDIKVIDSSDNFYRVYERVEFESNLIGHDVVFYYIDLIKDKEWNVISLEEVNPIERALEKKDITEADREEIAILFESFAKEVTNDYKAAEKYLIFRAKRSHKSSYNAFGKQAIKTSINNIHIDKVMYSTKNIAITKITYDNNSKPMAVLLSLYRTTKGWKIYDIKQI